ncbi:protein-tyrosine phosphatase [Eubacterium uniforme]|uniref:protein-tyrosine-phosphatase n=1 Tax=Eubacterium uniforme TaxID=39495 RepID=A0A1T4V912_9FIRM|nr:low molecular weight protein-tyrosine-phosphatase [Eubacterium uniforme]SKA61444.1 protein-tyrosine phosphatase [Eubacterium uniforme]
MIKVLFICHGNICRSTMAQFVMQDMVNKLNIADKFIIDSMATSTEEIGNGPHYGTVNKMREVGIAVLPHRATQLKKSDYANWDYIIGMDKWNIKNINRIIGEDKDNKVSMLLDYTDNPRDIADPWYTGNFDKTYDDIVEGLDAFLDFVLKREG